MGDKSTANPDARLNRFQKLPYYERTTAAIKCIEDLESSISFKETVIQSLQTRNIKLQSQLENFGDGTLKKSVDESGKNSEVDENNELKCNLQHKKQEVELHKPLYTCDTCHIPFKNVHAAFIHADSKRCHLPVNINTMTANSMSKEYMVYKCKECPTVCLNSLDLQIHKFLHQD